MIKYPLANHNGVPEELRNGDWLPLLNSLDIEQNPANGEPILTATGVAPGTYGDAFNVAQFTVDAKGRLFFAGNVPLAAASGTVSNVSFQDGDGFDGTVVTATTTPVISLKTTLNQGSVVFISPTKGITEDNALFFWDNTNKRLGLGTNAPIFRLHILGTTYDVNQFTSTNQGGYGAFFNNIANIPAGMTFGSGYTWAGAASAGTVQFSASHTISPGAIIAGHTASGSVEFLTAGNTITMQQTTSFRAMAGFQILSRTAGVNNGTVSHGASLLIQGVYPASAAVVTYQNYYGILINQLDEWGVVNLGNRWAIYQHGPNDPSYFGGQVRINNTTSQGAYNLQVTGGFYANVTSATMRFVGLSTDNTALQVLAKNAAGDNVWKDGTAIVAAPNRFGVAGEDALATASRFFNTSTFNLFMGVDNLGGPTVNGLIIQNSYVASLMVGGGLRTELATTDASVLMYASETGITTNEVRVFYDFMEINSVRNGVVTQSIDFSTYGTAGSDRLHLFHQGGTNNYGTQLRLGDAEIKLQATATPNTPASYKGIQVKLTGDLVFDNYLNTRDDGATLKALYVDATGTLKYGTVTMPSSAPPHILLGPIHNDTVAGAPVLGAMIVGNATSAWDRLLGHTVAAKRFLTQTGTGVNSAIPIWDSISNADIAGDALTKVDDANVTLTLGGTPATALLRAVSLTLGWNSTLAVTRGGTALAAVAQGDILYGSAANVYSRLAKSGTANQFLKNSGTANNPAWASVTLADVGVTAAALTKTDDTNITLTLGGSPNTALLAATSITVGWSGTLAPGRGGTGIATYALGDILYASATNVLSKLAGNITTGKLFLSQTGSGAVSAAPVWSAMAGSDITGAALTKTDDTNVTLTLGGTPATALLRAASITVGWTGTLAVTRGGTGLAAIAQGDIIYGSAANTFSILNKDATATRYLSNTGTSNNPAWAQINLANGVTGTLPSANLGNGLARSVFGVTGNAAAARADIQNTAADQVLVANGANTAIVWGTVATGGITNSAVTYAKIQNVTATARFLGRITAGAGVVEELTGTQATSLLDLFSTTTATKGVVPGSAGVGSTFFLRADGVWAVPPGSGGGGYTTLSQFVDETAWRIFYSNAAGDVTPLAFGTSGQVLQSTGATSAPIWAAAGGSGTIGGTIAATQVGYGSGVNTLTSSANFTFIVATGLLTINTATGKLIQLGDSAASTVTADPVKISMGGTFSSTAGANPKLILYDFTGTQAGLGISSSQLDYIVPGSFSHRFYVGSQVVDISSVQIGIYGTGQVGWENVVGQKMNFYGGSTAGASGYNMGVAGGGDLWHNVPSTAKHGFRVQGTELFNVGGSAGTTTMTTVVDPTAIGSFIQVSLSQTGDPFQIRNGTTNVFRVLPDGSMFVDTTSTVAATFRSSNASGTNVVVDAPIPSYSLKVSGAYKWSIIANDVSPNGVLDGNPDFMIYNQYNGRMAMLIDGATNYVAIGDNGTVGYGGAPPIPRRLNIIELSLLANESVPLVRLSRYPNTGGSAPLPGLGTGIETELGTSGAPYWGIASYIDTYWIQHTAGSQSSAFRVQLVNAGSALAAKFQVMPTGEIWVETLTQNDALTKVAVWDDTSKLIKWRAASTFGSGTIGGSLAATQVAYGSAANTITGSNDFNFVAGKLTLSKTTGTNLQLGDLVSLGTTTPVNINLGASYSTVAGANPKLIIHSDGYGIGISAAGTSIQEYLVPAGVWHRFYVGGVWKFHVDSAIIAVPNDVRISLQQGFGERITMYEAGGVTAGNYCFGVDSGTLWYNVSTGGKHDMRVNAVSIFQVHGSGATSPGTGVESERLGLNSNAAGNQSTAIGRNANVAAIATNGVALGYNSSVTNTSGTALGAYAISTGQYSVAIGAASNAAGTGSAALGFQTTAPGEYATAIGYQVNGSGLYSLAAGNGSTSGGTGSIALKGTTGAGHDWSIAIGGGATTTAANQMVIGGALGGSFMRDVYIGGGVTFAESAALIMTLQTSGAIAADTRGSILAIAAGRSTGTATGADILFKTSDPTTTGTTLQTLTTKLTVGQYGIQPYMNYWSVAPAGAAGYMQYNSYNNAMAVHDGTTWNGLVTTGGGTSGLGSTITMGITPGLKFIYNWHSDGRYKLQLGTGYPWSGDATNPHYSNFTQSVYIPLAGYHLGFASNTGAVQAAFLNNGLILGNHQEIPNSPVLKIGSWNNFTGDAAQWYAGGGVTNLVHIFNYAFAAATEVSMQRIEVVTTPSYGNNINTDQNGIFIYMNADLAASSQNYKEWTGIKVNVIQTNNGLPSDAMYAIKSLGGRNYMFDGVQFGSKTVDTTYLAYVGTMIYRSDLGKFRAYNGTVWKNIAYETGNGAWKVFYTDAAGTTTELAIGASGLVLTSNGAAAAPSWVAPPGAGGGGTPGLPDTSVQYNGAGSFAGSAQMTFATGTLTLNKATGTNIQLGVNTSAAVADPVRINMGGSYSSTAGANPKLILYNDGTQLFGMGVSASSLDYVTPTGCAHNFYISGAGIINVSSGGIGIADGKVISFAGATTGNKIYFYYGGGDPGNTSAWISMPSAGALHYQSAGPQTFVVGYSARFAVYDAAASVGFSMACYQGDFVAQRITLHSSQSADAFQIYNSGGSPLVKVDAGGNTTINAALTVSNAVATIAHFTSSYYLGGHVYVDATLHLRALGATGSSPYFATDSVGGFGIYNDATAFGGVHFTGNGWLHLGHNSYGLVDPQRVLHLKQFTGSPGGLYPLIRLEHAHYTPVVVSMGVGIEYSQSGFLGGYTGVVWGDITAAAERFDYVVQLMNGGAAATEKFRVLGTGEIMPQTVVQDDTQTKVMVWDSATKLVKYRASSTLGGAGSSTKFGKAGEDATAAENRAFALGTFNYSITTTTATSNNIFFSLQDVTGMHTEMRQSTSRWWVDSYTDETSTNKEAYLEVSAVSGNPAVYIFANNAEAGLCTQMRIQPNGVIVEPLGSTIPTVDYIFKGMVENVGTKTLRYNPATGDVTYHDIPTGGAGTGFATADNGLTASSATNVQLFGPTGSPATLLNSRALTAGAFSLAITGTANNILTITNTDAGNMGGLSVATNGGGAVMATSTSNTAVSGQSGSGSGGSFRSTGSTAVDALSFATNQPAIYALNGSSGAGTVRPGLWVARAVTSAAATDNTGVSIDFYVESSDEQMYITNQIVSKWTTVNLATRRSSLTIIGVNAGLTADLFTLSGLGATRYHKYGVGSFLGVPAYSLGVDASGNMVEFVPAVGGGTIGGSIAANQVAYGTGSNTIAGSANFTWDGQRVTVAASQSWPSYVTGTLYLQSYSLSNSWISENAFHNAAGGGWFNTATGAGGVLQFGAGEVAFRLFPSQPAGTMLTSYMIVSQLKLDATGAFGIGGAIVSTSGVYTGAHLYSDAAGNITLNTVAQDDAQTRLLVWDSTTKVIKWRAASTITGGGGGMADPAANGWMVRTALNVSAARTLVGTTNRLTITNPDGTAGNPVFDVGALIVDRSQNNIYSAGALQTFQGSSASAGIKIEAQASNPSTMTGGELWWRTSGYMYAYSSGVREFVWHDATQTLSNKTINNTNTIAVKDLGSFLIQNATDVTKQVAFDLSAIATLTLITLFIPPQTTTLVGNDSTQTLTNKRITARVGTITSASSITIDSDANDIYTVTALAANLAMQNPSGTPTNGQKLMIRIKDNVTARGITWPGTQWRAGDIALPLTTIANRTMYLGFIWNSTDSKWDFMAYNDNFI